MRNIVGDERRLIDEQGWRDFCVPPCDCGGEDCWFHIKDRWVSYDITSRIWGVQDPRQLRELKEDLTESARLITAYKAYPYEGVVYWMLKNRSIEGMLGITSDYWRWMPTFLQEYGGWGLVEDCWWPYDTPDYCYQYLNSGSFAYRQAQKAQSWLYTTLNSPRQECELKNLKNRHQ